MIKKDLNDFFAFAAHLSGSDNGYKNNTTLLEGDNKDFSFKHQKENYEWLKVEYLHNQILFFQNLTFFTIYLL